MTYKAHTDAKSGKVCLWVCMFIRIEQPCCRLCLTLLRIQCFGAELVVVGSGLTTIFTCWACSRFGQVIQNFSFDSIQKRFKKNSCLHERNTLNNVNESHNNITLVYSNILE